MNFDLPSNENPEARQETRSGLRQETDAERVSVWGIFHKSDIWTAIKIKEALVEKILDQEYMQHLNISSHIMAHLEVKFHKAAQADEMAWQPLRAAQIENPCPHISSN